MVISFMTCILMPKISFDDARIQYKYEKLWIEGSIDL